MSGNNGAVHLCMRHAGREYGAREMSTGAGPKGLLMKKIRFCFLPLRALVALLHVSCLQPGRGAIDREQLVRRHFPGVSGADPLSPFSVGNGKFAFTSDITGLQTFPEFYEKGIPLATQSEWG